MAEMKYRYYPELNLVYLKPEGCVTIKDIIEYGYLLLERGHMKEGTVEYVDMSNMTNLQLDYVNSKKLIKMHEDWINAGWYASGYYAPEAVQLGLIRMLGSVMETLEGAVSGFMHPFDKWIEIEELRDFLTRHLNPDIDI